MGASGSMHAACRHDDLARLQKEVAKSKNVNQYDMFGASALHYACGYGSLSCAKFILDQSNVKIDIREKEKGNTPLHCAVCYRHHACTQLLLERGASVAIANKHGDTPLHVAAATGQDVVCEWLLLRGADPKVKNKKNETPLDLALAHSHVKVVHLLGRQALVDSCEATKLTRAMVEAAPDDLTCSICLSEYEVGEDVRILPCRHKFHKSCTDSWLTLKLACPTCRFDLTSQLYSSFMAKQESQEDARTQEVRRGAQVEARGSPVPPQVGMTTPVSPAAARGSSRSPRSGRNTPGTPHAASVVVAATSVAFDHGLSISVPTPTSILPHPSPGSAPTTPTNAPTVRTASGSSPAPILVAPAPLNPAQRAIAVASGGASPSGMRRHVAG
eukprot:tig00001155_g7327.t1